MQHRQTGTCCYLVIVCARLSVAARTHPLHFTSQNCLVPCRPIPLLQVLALLPTQRRSRRGIGPDESAHNI